MAWLCVDEDGQEMIFDNEPKRDTSSLGGYWNRNEEEDYCNVDLPKGTIKKLIGKELTWKDEPYEYYTVQEDIITQIPERKKKFNWRIMLLSIIWSTLFVCLSDIVMNLKSGRLISVVLIILIISFVFYFGYKDVDITNKVYES